MGHRRLENHRQSADRHRVGQYRTGVRRGAQPDGGLSYFQNIGNAAAGSAAHRFLPEPVGRAGAQCQRAAVGLQREPDGLHQRLGHPRCRQRRRCNQRTRCFAQFRQQDLDLPERRDAVTTLLNLNEANAITMSGGHNVNILAANAATTFSSGVVTRQPHRRLAHGRRPAELEPRRRLQRRRAHPSPGGAFALVGGGLVILRRRRG